jgi:hypothetical protein
MFSKLLVRIALVTLLANGATSLVFAQRPWEGPPPPGDPRAEQVADQIMKTFYENLDFGDVYRKWYVKNPKLRLAEVDIIVGNLIRQGDRFDSKKAISRNIDDSTMERAYVAMGNYHWNMDALSLTGDLEDRVFKQEFEEVFKKYYEPFNQKSNWPILTSKEVDQRLTARFIGLADFFRSRVAKTRIGTAEFLTKQAKIEETKPPDSKEGLINLFSKVGLTKNDHLFLARRGRHYIYLIEEDGELRMFSFTGRIRF